MPLTEAQSCGVPTMAVDYSAMKDHLLCPTSMPIRVQRFFYEPVIETEQKRALPDNTSFITHLDRMTRMSKQKLKQLREKTRQYIIEKVDTHGQEQKMSRYSWDRTACIWKNLLNEISIYNDNKTWLCPQPKINKPVMIPPKNNMNNTEFMVWLVRDIYKKPELVRHTFTTNWIKCLNRGYIVEGMNKVPVDRNKVIEYFMNMIQNENNAELARVASLNNKEKSDLDFMVI